MAHVNPTDKEVENAFRVILERFKHYIETPYEKPITMLSAEFTDLFEKGSSARLMTYFVFYGKDETPKLKETK